MNAMHVQDIKYYILRINDCRYFISNVCYFPEERAA